MVKDENDKLISRLYNWKFESAVQYLEGEDDYVKDVVNALADTFGNVGWNVMGSMGLIIQASLSKICPQIDDEDESDL